ncbi:MAG TPA: hypothetical protein VHE58_04515 [Burkholderiales bacterium]|nr:hypothetical protein [Burkholderiales bacterium]
MRFPPWLPQIVADHATQLIDSGGLGEKMTERLKRLTTDAGMRAAWAALAKYAPQPQDLVDYLEYARLHYTLMWHGYWRKFPALSSQRRALKRVAKLGKELLKELEAIGGNNPAAGLAALEHLLNQVVTHSFALRKENQTIVHAFTLKQTLADLQRETGIENVLNNLIQAAELALQAPPVGPRKLRDKNADRTAYIQDLARYVKRRFGKPLNEVVANTVNASFNFHDNPVTEDLVRKLTRSTRKISANSKP